MEFYDEVHAAIIAVIAGIIGVFAGAYYSEYFSFIKVRPRKPTLLWGRMKGAHLIGKIKHIDQTSVLVIN